MSTQHCKVIILQLKINNFFHFYFSVIKTKKSQTQKPTRKPGWKPGWPALGCSEGKFAPVFCSHSSERLLWFMHKRKMGEEPYSPPHVASYKPNFEFKSPNVKSWKNTQQNTTEIPPPNPVTRGWQLAFHPSMGGSSFFKRRGSLVFTRTRGSMLSCSQTFARPLSHMECTFLPPTSFCSRPWHALPTCLQQAPQQAEGRWREIPNILGFFLPHRRQEQQAEEVPLPETALNQQQTAVSGRKSSFLHPQLDNILACSREWTQGLPGFPQWEWAPVGHMGNLSFIFFSFIFISWRLITLQYCSGFCHTLTWISHGFTCVPHPDPPSWNLSFKAPTPSTSHSLTPWGYFLEILPQDLLPGEPNPRQHPLRQILNRIFPIKPSSTKASQVTSYHI